MDREHYIERLAQALLPFVYPAWQKRWGWTEATEEMKEHCRTRAESVASLVHEWDKDKA